MDLSLWNKLTLAEKGELERFCSGPITDQMVRDKIANRPDTTHAEFYCRDNHYDVKLVESAEGRWSIFHGDQEERHPSEKEAKIRYMYLLAANGVSP